MHPDLPTLDIYGPLFPFFGHVAKLEYVKIYNSASFDLIENRFSICLPLIKRMRFVKGISFLAQFGLAINLVQK